MLSNRFRSVCSSSGTSRALKQTFSPVLSTSNNLRLCSTDDSAAAESKPGRTQVTLEVIVSKIFPAGFCWQGASVIAEGMLALSPESIGFALVTGVGDAIGVYAGHTTLYKIKESIGTKVNMKQEHQIGRWLASAAFLSGTAWQPAVNVFAGMGLAFTPAAVATTAVCGTAFFAGLRLGRGVYNVGKADSTNLGKDAQLGLSIGGATGAFVGTDISFAGNWLRPVVGVEETMSTLTGMVKAGSSTSLGFSALQFSQNVVVPSKAAWNDA